jgi:N-acyl-L-homoserine lactone synthetase
MIITFSGRERHLFPTEVDQMFRLRADIFGRRLGWNVRLTDGWEIDELDECNPLYVLSMKDDKVVGCARLLPTTGPTLLNTYFHADFDEPIEICSPYIVEATRLAVAEGAPHGLSRRGVCLTTVQLLLAGCMIMERGDFTYCLGLYYQQMLRIYRRVGWTPHVVGKSRDSKIGVGLWKADRGLIDRLCSLHGLGPEDVAQQDWAILRRSMLRTKSA